MILSEESAVLLRLIIAHLLTDFVLQPSSWVKDRTINRLRSAKLYLHGFITAAAAYILSGLWTIWWLPLVIFVGHVIIDLWKSYQTNRPVYFLADQALHLLVIFLVWAAVFNTWNDAGLMLFRIMTDTKALVLISGYLASLWPLGIFIGIATERWRQNAAVNTEGLAKAGMRIGLLERFLIVTFVLINQFTAVGFLIAAKSILRFSDKENTQKKTEYVLIGTLMSFTASFVLGLVMRYFISGHTA